MASIIEVKHLNLWYGDHQALKDINIDIPEHKITALIGPSGCGKSTFMKTLNRMNDLVKNCRIEGDVRLNGHDIYKDMDVNVLRKNYGERSAMCLFCTLKVMEFSIDYELKINLM